MPPHEPGILRASQRCHHNLGLWDHVGGLGSVPDEVPLSFTAVPDTGRVDHLSVVCWNATKDKQTNKQTASLLSHWQTAMTTYNEAVCHAGQHKERVYTMLTWRHVRAHKALRHGSHSFTCKLHHACLLFRKRSPDGATPKWGGRHLMGACYSFIDREWMKGWVGLERDTDANAAITVTKIFKY